MNNVNEVIIGIWKLMTEMQSYIAGKTDDELSRKSSPEKWSKKEILGHLCDSAFNNIQRLVRVQHEVNPSIVYNQDAWVKANNYQNQPILEVLNLWIALHLQFVEILKSFPENSLGSTIFCGEPVTALFVLEDYLHHQLHHFAQIKS